MLRTRLITGAVLIGFLLCLAWVDANWTGWVPPSASRVSPLLLFSCLFLAPMLGGELHGLCARAGVRASKWVMRIAAALGCICPWLLTMECNCSEWIILIPPAITLLAAVAFFGDEARGSTENPLSGVAAAIGVSLLAFAWTGIGLGAWAAISAEHGSWVLAATVLVVKCSDIGGYFTGMAIGRHKLIPALSPGKTWEGLAGGIALSAVAALVAWQFIGTESAIGGEARTAPSEAVPVIPLLLGGALMGIAGPVGDLLESMLKRGAGAKDSGKILPGMGGLLDLFDSLLLAGPLAWWLLRSWQP